MRYYVIAGEASGDLHASNLMKELKLGDQYAEFRAWGGDLMQAQGAVIVKHYRELAFMGFLEVIMNLRTILKNIDFCKKDLGAYKPDALILVDYPGFNMRIAAYAHKQGIKVFYYISPQIWAWKQGRVKKLKATVDEMYVILPFEKDFYLRFGMDVHFVGHPLIDAVSDYHMSHLSDSSQRFVGAADQRPIIAILPGSRKQEISKMLPIMLAVSENFPNYKFVLAGAPSQPLSFYQPFLRDFPGVEIVFGKTYDLLGQAYAAVVTSGTATLETAIFKVPQVVCYKGSWFSYLIARQLIKVKYISLVNLIMDRAVVTELIQGDYDTDSLKAELQNLLDSKAYRANLSVDYDALYAKLGGEGASRLTADLMLKNLHDSLDMSASSI